MKQRAIKWYKVGEVSVVLVAAGGMACADAAPVTVQQVTSTRAPLATDDESAETLSKEEGTKKERGEKDYQTQILGDPMTNARERAKSLPDAHDKGRGEADSETVIDGNGKRRDEW